MLPEFEMLSAFMLASIGLTLLPGPDNLFVISQSILHGSRTGIATALGMAAGNFVHTLAVAIGLSALILATPALFSLIKALGVSYLLYLAWQSWQHPMQIISAHEPDNAHQLSTLQLFKRGALMNILNPKAALFFLAFFPQFIDMESDHKALQIFLLGSLFVLQSGLIFSGIALMAGRLQTLMMKVPPRWLAGITAGLFVLLSVYLAISAIR